MPVRPQRPHPPFHEGEEALIEEEEALQLDVINNDGNKAKHECSPSNLFAFEKVLVGIHGRCSGLAVGL
jgi:hypothetical protein